MFHQIDLQKKQYNELMSSGHYVPEERKDLGRGRLVTKEMLKVQWTCIHTYTRQDALLDKSCLKM